MIKGEHFASNCVIEIMLIIIIADQLPSTAIHICAILRYSIAHHQRPSYVQERKWKARNSGVSPFVFLLRHNSMISVTNIKASCDVMRIKDTRCGWRQAVGSITESERRIQLQR